MARQGALTQADAARRKRIRVSLIMIFAVIPGLLVLSGFLISTGWYMPLSILILFAVMAPFFMVFERRRPRAREIVLIAMMSALAVVVHLFFHVIFPIPVGTAVIVLAGASLGPEAGFLIGAMARFICNFALGQGMWTPWQMFCWGLIGFLAGIFFLSGADYNPRGHVFGFPAKGWTLALFTFLSTFLIYGSIMNVAGVLIGTGYPDAAEFQTATVLAAFASGLTYNLFHAISATVVVFFVGEGLVKKMERVKIKYGIYK